jgi:hypothetical protein
VLSHPISRYNSSVTSRNRTHSPGWVSGCIPGLLRRWCGGVWFLAIGIAVPYWSRWWQARLHACIAISLMSQIWHNVLASKHCRWPQRGFPYDGEESRAVNWPGTQTFALVLSVVLVIRPIRMNMSTICLIAICRVAGSTCTVAKGCHHQHRRWPLGCSTVSVLHVA